MAFVLSDRIKETTTTTSTGTYTLGGAVSGFETFTANLSNGDTTYYCCTDGTDFEVGLGTFASSGTTLARTTIISSSNSNNAVNWSSGSRDIFCTLPGSKAVFKDGSDNINGTFVGNITGDVTGNVSGTAATVTGAAQSNITSVGTLTGLTTSGTINLSQSSGVAIKTTGSLSSADLTVLRAGINTDSAEFGFDIKYMGARSGNSNSYSLFMHNQQGTDVEAMTVLQNGKVGINNISPSDTLDVGGDATITGDLNIISTDAGSGDDPNLVLYRNSSSPADDDNIGTIQFKGRNDNSQDVVYGEIQSIIQDASDGTEDSSLSLQVRRGGTATTYINLSGESGRVNIQRDLFISTGYDITFEGDTSDAFETVLKVADPTADRTVTLPDATGTVSLITATETLTNKTLTSPTINGFSGTGDGTITGDLTLTSTDAGSSEGPSIDLNRNSASPAANDLLGTISFKGEDSASNQTTYAKIQSVITDTTDGSEDGLLRLQANINGTMTTYYDAGYGANFFFKKVALHTGVDLSFEGSTNDSNETTLTVTDPTADRTITLPDATGDVLLNESGTVNIRSTADEGPEIYLISNDHSDAGNFQTEGNIYFFADNNANEQTLFARILMATGDVADGAEDGWIYIYNTINGSNVVNAGFGDGNLVLHDDDAQIEFWQQGGTSFSIKINAATPSATRTVTLPDATGTILTTGNSDTPTTTTSSSDADFVLVDDGGTMKKITPANLGITSGGASKGFAVAMAIAL